MRLEARAKINWTLDITGVRQDGYHLMDMLMQPVTLVDAIDLQEADDISLCIEDSPNPALPALPADETNLMWRAARALQQATGTRKGVSMRLQKCIPSQAGLGGGSADAAAVLVGLNQLWQLHLPQEDLERIGLTLGADVPFCIRGGFCRVQGIGEVLTDLPAPPERWLVIVQPCAGLSTGAVFRAYHAAETVRHPDTEAALQALLSGSEHLPLGNVMQEVSTAMRPEIPEAVERFLASGAIAAQMSGSGSAVFGVFRNEEDAKRAQITLQALYGQAHLCHTCSESVIITSLL